MTTLLWPWWNEDAWCAFAIINGYGALCAAQALLLRHAAARYADALFVPTHVVKLGAQLYRTPEVLS